MILSTIGLAINNGVMWILVEHFCLWYAAAKIFATAVVMIFNFVTRKLLLEGKSA